MSGLSFSERVKLLLQKRLDATKWPLGDSGQGPGAIRYLSDGQGNAIALLTTSINPNDPEPIGPGSAEASAEVDPVIIFGDALHIPYSITKKTNLVPVSLTAIILTTNSHVTFELPEGTDYSVPAGKDLLIYRVIFQSAIAGMVFNIAYGDDGVAAGTTEPTNPVYIIGSTNNGGSPLKTQTADKMENIPIYGRIPADKFPFIETAATSGDKAMQLLGVEVDA